MSCYLFAEVRAAGAIVAARLMWVPAKGLTQIP
jgi:hypothetical protein